MRETFTIPISEGTLRVTVEAADHATHSNLGDTGRFAELTSRVRVGIADEQTRTKRCICGSTGPGSARLMIMCPVHDAH